MGEIDPVAVPMKAGDCSFHNGICAHGAGANMTRGRRIAMTCAYMPVGSTFNGQRNILPKPYFESLKVGDSMDNDAENPLVYSKDLVAPKFANRNPGIAMHASHRTRTASLPAHGQVLRPVQAGDSRECGKCGPRRRSPQSSRTSTRRSVRESFPPRSRSPQLAACT